MADNESYGARLRRFWAPNGAAFLWLLLGLAPLFFFQTFVHEGLHWLKGKQGGADPTLIPFAHYSTSFERNMNGTTIGGIGFVATPQFVCLGLLILLIVVFIKTSPKSRSLRTFLTWWYLGIMLDLLANTWLGLFGAPRGNSDWGKFSAEAGKGVAFLVSLLVLVAALSQLLWIKISKWHVNRPAGLGFYEYRGLAIFYAILCLIVVIISHTIDHESIVRNWWFWLVWFWELVSLIAYIGYVVWATVRPPAKPAASPATP